MTELGDFFRDFEAEEIGRKLMDDISNPYYIIEPELKSGSYCMDYNLGCGVLILQVKQFEELNEKSLEKIGRKGYELIGNLNYKGYVYYLFYPNKEIFKKRVMNLVR